MGKPGPASSGLTVHDFRADLRYSLAGRDEDFWQAVYERAFPNLRETRLCEDLRWQRQGVDRLLYLNNGRILAVDEKKRRRDYGDILLEHVSNDATGAPGWMEKDLAIDWLAYAFMESQRVYLINWYLLRRAWGHYGAEWLALGAAQRDGFRLVVAHNEGYATHSVAVPIPALTRALRAASIIQL